MSIDVIRREVLSTGLQSDLGAFGGEVDQGLLRIRTDEGVEGQCLVGQFRGGGIPLFDPILKALKPELLGRDPAEREWLWSRLGILGSRRGLTFPAWAPVDVALWDLTGKAAGMPVHRLLGTSRHQVDVYATYPPRHEDPDGYVREAEDLMDRGFRAYKIHPGVMGTNDVVEMVGRVRDLAGESFPLMLDPNNGYRFRKALDIGRALDDNDFYWYEDPVPWNEFDSILELTNRLDTPLCMSDLAEFRFREAAHYIRLGAVRLPRGTARKLGITGLKKLCSMAEGFGLNCEIGTAGNSSLDAANLHVMLSLDNCDFFEWWLPSEARQFGYLNDLAPNGESRLQAPTGPGLGLELDEEWISRHRLTTLE